MENVRKNLENVLKNDTVEVTFTKVNGEVRTIYCTQNFDLIPKEQHPKTNKSDLAENKVEPKTISVFDLNEQCWKSFRVDNLISYNVNLTDD